ncbi:hypothetical protein JFT86_15040 [Pseudomonas sp. TH06]|nr:hypothetical protein [Pseudomonas sp. TH06]
MNRFFLALAVLLCCSCSSNHGRPIAALDYKSVSISPSRSSFFISFSSNTDLLGLFQSKIGEGLVCALGDDLDFSIGHYQKLYGNGIVETSESASKGKYIARVIFRETGEVQGKERILDGDALRGALMANDFVVCTFRVNTTKYKTYFSEFMRIPSKDFLKELVRSE